MGEEPAEIQSLSSDGAMYDLRDYQTIGIGRIRAALRAGNRRVVCELPTGGGKTIIALKGIVLPAVARGKRVWFVAPRRQLIHQTSCKLEELGMYDHGVLQGEHWRKRPHAPIQVASKDTLIRRLDKVLPPDVIILDEAHHATDDNSYWKIVEAFPNAYVIGFTATPCRLDGKGLGRVFDSMVHIATINDLIGMGFLVPPRLFRGPKVDLSDIKKSAGDYNQKQLGDRMDSQPLIGDMVVEWMDHARDLPTVVFATNIAHSHHIVERFRERGIAAEHIDGETPDAVRQRILKDLAGGVVKVVSSVGVFTEGFDCPAVGCVIFARPTQSLALYIQMGGRGLRPRNGVAEPGEHCVFLDHANLTVTHGYLTDERHWSLADGYVEKDEGENKEHVRPRYRCPHCSAEMRGWPTACPECGEALPQREQRQFEIVEDTTRLVEVTPEQMAEEQAIKLAERREYYARIAAYAFERQHKPISVNVKFKKRFGEWPNKEDRRGSEHQAVCDWKTKEWTWRDLTAKEPKQPREQEAAQPLFG